MPIPALLGRFGRLASRVPALERLVRAWADAHIAIYRLTGGRLFGNSTLLLTTIGRRSGRLRTTPLYFVRDGESYVVIASYGGSDRHPAWFLNLQATARALAEVRGHRIICRAELVPPDDRPELWRRLIDVYPIYERYQRATRRTLPVVRLVPAAAATREGSEAVSPPRAAGG